MNTPDPVVLNERPSVRAHFPHGLAALCSDCDAVFFMPLNVCPACGSSTFVALSQFRSTKKETP